MPAHQPRAVPLPVGPSPVFGSFVVGAAPPAGRVTVAIGLVAFATGVAGGVWVAVFVAVLVAVGVAVRILRPAGVAVRVGVTVAVAVAVRDAVGLAVDVAVAVVVGAACACVRVGARAPMPHTAAAIPASPSEVSALLVRIDCTMLPLSLSAALRAW